MGGPRPSKRGFSCAIDILLLTMLRKKSYIKGEKMWKKNLYKKISYKLMTFQVLVYTYSDFRKTYKTLHGRATAQP